MITVKTLIMALPRLEWMFLHLLPYDLVIKCRPGKEMLLVDALLCPASWEDHTDPLNLWVDHIILSEKCLCKIIQETAIYPVLSVVYHLTHQGWPASCQHIPKVSWHYWEMCDEISTNEGILVKRHCTVIPPSFLGLPSHRQSTQGLSKCQQTANDTIYWLRINGNVKDYGKKSQICSRAKPSLPTKPLPNC